ncbi:MAG TPA: proton-conducting transporter membrane subunit [Methylomirabilota bacterium]|jgi:formate hydrogenlyase subunit 3/multisubunit Na+/H+ antiporter MnhD subunit|nr:proton-conducting transporter membrane subunit [Methylomirabilota bacterium]
MAALVYVATAVIGLLGAVAGVAGMLGHTWNARVAWVVPLGGLELVMDPMAGLFLALVGAAAVPASIYAIGYTAGARRGLIAYPAFVASMAAVPLAANVMTFAVAWELMSLASYFLVVDGARDPREGRATARAAWTYAVMTHAGLAAMLTGMLLLISWTGSATFADWRQAAPALAPSARGLAWLLLAAGFAVKAGVIPLHVWLPLAHPAAPSHVSALMSGVMIKLGIYGLLRASFDWLGTGPAWWGVTLLLAGAVSAVVGVLDALVERDLKRLLAFSSIENIGIILLGMGAALLFAGAGLPALAVFALVAALYHVVNHAAFKSLLFLGAGAVLHATGTRDMEAHGGLVKRMPWTGACFFLGSAAIAALPPLNGFVSEWLIFQALLQNTRILAPGLNVAFTLGIAALALTGGLAVACFVKAFGISFLAMPRSEAAARAHEAPLSMRAAMVALALACVALGLAPTAVVPALASVAASRLGGSPAVAFGDGLTLRLSGDFASLSTLTIALALAAALALVALAGAGRRRRWYETWGCGRLLQTSRMEYTATAFANPFTRIFDFFYRPVKRLDIDFHPESRFFVSRIEYGNPTRSIFDEWLYRPAGNALRATARHVQAIQSGSTNLYLIYILAALLVLLVFA